MGGCVVSLIILGALRRHWVLKMSVREGREAAVISMQGLTVCSSAVPKLCCYGAAENNVNSPPKKGHQDRSWEKVQQLSGG